MIHLDAVEGGAVGKEGADFHPVGSDSVADTDHGSTGCSGLGSSADMA